MSWRFLGHFSVSDFIAMHIIVTKGHRVLLQGSLLFVPVHEKDFIRIATKTAPADMLQAMDSPCADESSLLKSISCLTQLLTGIAKVASVLRHVSFCHCFHTDGDRTTCLVESSVRAKFDVEPTLPVVSEIVVPNDDAESWIDHVSELSCIIIDDFVCGLNCSLGYGGLPLSLLHRTWILEWWMCNLSHFH